MEPGVTIEREVASGADVEGLTTQFTRDDHAIGGIGDCNSTSFVNDRTVEIQIWRGSIGGVSGWHRNGLADILGDIDRASDRGAGARCSSFAIDIEGAGIKDRIDAIDDVDDFRVVNHHVLAKQHYRRRIGNGD